MFRGKKYQESAKLIDKAALYIRIYFLGLPFMVIYNFGAAILRSYGDTRRPLYYLIISGTLNVILNLLLVIQFQMDVAGVAIATVVSQCISAALVTACLMRETGGFRLELRALRIHGDQMKGILLGAVIIVVLGVVDDMTPLRAKFKFLVQICAALVAVYHGVVIEILTNPNVFSDAPYWSLGWMKYPVTVLWIVGVTNAVNLIDGLDGLASGVSTISAMTMLVIAILVSEQQVAIVMAALAGACLGFMPYNKNPAKMFMGDTGSTFLGYILATYSIQGLFKYYAIVSFAVPFLVLGLPIFDTAFAIVRRVARGQSPMTPDRGHIHHRMMDMGLNQKQTVAALYVVSSLLGLSAVVLTTSGELKAMLLLLTLAAVAYVASRVIFPREIAETAHEKELEQEEMQAKSAAPVPEGKEEKHEEN